MSKRAITVARKILKSDPVSPARMTDPDRDEMWTLQWSDLRRLALSAAKAERFPRKKGTAVK